ncbi:helix-turn-helix domain-containing protein [Streptococcus parauberis]|uniref:DNA-binding helix-turn-helix protein n=2 Tax=Streptococcus parauberis TaxID=1348 RepID=F1Z0U2_9STRE|nr:helix-turn-helix domain-containing protein [Streptococcus parauberis]EGE53225.1 DNA-binding helix-turn-helix protein [Streptococcus parauberis NCFD 2020]MDT2748994.1 helix-turn-helix domain-containing protein [Streptococcus parauberis]PCH13139.1 HTH-type transcriptional regulator Xre [Streptococcus parauberis]RFE00891.1 HTH-type transcriptional regulator Xre [Streptococcus parauberis]UWM90437.1 helix-turn-helix domain-containing protein [Streptococcus parauberis]
MSKFSTRLKELRKEKKITQQDLGNAIGVSRVTITKWEKEYIEPNISQITDLAIFFDVSIDYLTGKTDLDYSKLNAESVLKMPQEEREKFIRQIIDHILLTIQVSKQKGVSETEIERILVKNGIEKEIIETLLNQL